MDICCLELITESSQLTINSHNMKSSIINKTRYSIIILLILTACTTQTVTLHTQNPVTVTVEIADEPAEYEQGLMYRKYLAENHGMLFVFDEKKPLTFWMKNTLIPLDIIFIAGNKMIDIKQDFQPCKQEPCETYTSLPADKVIEVNAGFVEKNNVTIGTKVTF